MSERSHNPGLPSALTAPLDGGPSRILPLALLAAVTLHLFLILGVAFKLPTPERQPAPDAALEVLLLKDAGETTRNPEPDATLSQRARVGESPQGDGVVSATQDPPPHPTPTEPEEEPLDDADPQDRPPAPVAPEPAPPAPPTPTLAPQEPRPTRLAAPPSPKPRPVPKVPEAPPPPQPAEPTRTVDAAQILASRDQEVTRLTDNLQTRVGAGRPRRKAVSASTREFRYANYLGAWARKVENIGNLNYPQAAKDQSLYGNLILDVAVRADGSVEQVRVVRSSGYPLLDQAAIDIVNLAAPYSPFPPDIAAETDVLDIVRTWQFLRGGRLGWQ